MTNLDVFKEYSSEKWVIEQALSFLLQEFVEENKYEHPKVNPIGIIKKFLDEETVCDVEWAEKAKMNRIEDSVVNVVYEIGGNL